MLRWRLLLGTLLIAAMIGLCWLDMRAAVPGAWMMPLAILAAVACTQEVLELASFANLRPLRSTVYCGNVLLTSSSWLAVVLVLAGNHWTLPSSGDPVFWWLGSSMITYCVLGGAVLSVVFGEMARYEKPGGNLANIAVGTFVLLYVGLALHFAVQMRIGWGIGALAAWVIVVKMGDIGAYTVGRLIGRHKMAPLISPGKTIEGAFGSLAFSCLGAWLAFRFVVPWTAQHSAVAMRWSHPWSLWWGWIAFGLLVGAAGMLGDLAESLLKRDVGRKDSSTWLPGFGGVLDILDSLLLSAPVAWACWFFGLVG